MRAAASAGLAAAALIAAGCGEKTYDAGEVVAELNAAGAALELGEPLGAAGELADAEVVELSFSAPAPSAGIVPTGEHTHAAGALVVLDDADAASAEFSRCEGAIDFTCYRAANVVLRFTGMTPEEQSEMNGAVSQLETG